VEEVISVLSISLLPAQNRKTETSFCTSRWENYASSASSLYICPAATLLYASGRCMDVQAGVCLLVTPLSYSSLSRHFFDQHFCLRCCRLYL